MGVIRQMRLAVPRIEFQIGTRIELQPMVSTNCTSDAVNIDRTYTWEYRYQGCYDLLAGRNTLS